MAGGVAGLKGQQQALRNARGQNAIGAPIQNQPPSGIDRRLAQQQMPLEERMQQLQVAEAVIPELPRPVQEEVAPTIFHAMILTAQEARQQGLA